MFGLGIGSALFLILLAVLLGKALCPRLIDDFGGTVPAPVTLTVVTPGGGSVTVPIHGIESLTAAVREHKTDKWTPISGVRAFLEQVLICSESAVQMSATLTYELDHYLELDAIVGTNGCAVTFTLSDGFTLTGTGGVSKLGLARVEDSKHVTSDLTIELAAGWTATDGGATGFLAVPAYTKLMAAGVGTIDLTACGSAGSVNLTGKTITKVVITALATNGNAVTVVEGASNGYPLGASFSQVLSAGESVTVEKAAGFGAVSGTDKTIDLSGTLAQGVTVYIECIDP